MEKKGLSGETNFSLQVCIFFIDEQNNKLKVLE